MIQNSDGKELYYGAYEYIYEDCKNIKKGKYYLLGNTPHNGFIEIKVPKSKWACFKLSNKKQKEIWMLYDTIYNHWLPVSEYHKEKRFLELEIYYKDSCEICIPIQ